MRRIALFAMLSATMLDAAYVYECGRFYDCITPFGPRVRAPLPTAGSIPLPPGLDPALFLTPMTPTISNSRGTVAGHVGFRASSPLPFLFDGATSRILFQDGSYRVQDISESGMVILRVGGTGTVFTWDGGSINALSFLGHESALFYVTDFVTFGSGDQMLLVGERRAFDLSLLEQGVRLLYSPAPVARVPEPPSAAPAIGMLALFLAARRTRARGHRPFAIRR